MMSFSSLLRSAATIGVRSFHSSRIMSLAVGDKIPSVEIQKGNPKGKFDVAEFFKGKKGVLVTVPGAFTPACSDTHVPGYINHIDDFKKKGYEVLVVCANDAFVVDAWGKTFKHDGKMTFVADPEAKLAKVLDLQLELVPVFGQGKRYQRSALVIDNNVVKSINTETDGTVTKSAASNILKQI